MYFFFRFENQIKAFLVGGPNVRKDFHLEEGEEVIVQIFATKLFKILIVKAEEHDFICKIHK